jgi:hypothetical protein
MAGASTIDGSDEDSGKDSGKASDSCWLCREASVGGHYFPPQNGLAVPSPPPVAWLALPELAHWSLRRQSIGWSGRAPPQ